MSVMAAACPLPRTPDLPTLHDKLQGLLSFLRGALAISSAHTVDFYTKSVWQELVDLPPESVLAALRESAVEAEPREAETGSGFTELPKIFCETSQKLLSVEAFARTAKHYSVQNLGLCTPSEQLLTALQGNKRQRVDENVKAIEFMNTKKSHEVQAMSELICSIADYCGLKQIIDVGSGKGYLSSFLSLKYGLNVYGIDSSNTNTHGAKERNRKLKKHWSLYHPHSRADANGWASERPRELKVPKGVECKGDAESVQRSRLGNPDLSATDGLPDFSGSAISVIRKQQKNVLAQPAEEENLYFEDAFSLIDFLPVDAIEPTSSQVQNTEKSGLRKERRNTASKARDSSIYSPLTSFITADSQLHDIIEDLEDCLMVGLHTCGDLAPSTLRIFTSKAEVKAVCSVGCCYHLLSEEFENQHKDRCANENWGFPMCHYLKEERWCCGRNARMSACLALQRVAVGQGLPTESLFYRAVLQNIIKDYYGISKCEQHVGKIYSKCSSFLEYVRMSLKKLGLDESKRHFQELQSVCCVLCSRWEQNLLDVFYVRLIYDRPGCSLCPMVGFLNVSEEIIMDYYENYKPRMNELEAFNMLKVVLAPCIETLILLDRLCYLKEQDGVAWSALVKLFDPVQSPRCYAVIALKKQCDRG